MAPAPGSTRVGWPWALFRAERDIDIAVRGVRIRTDLMGLLNQVADDRLIEAVVGDLEGDVEVEALTASILAEADGGGDLRIRAHGRARLAGHQPQGAEVA